MAKVSQRIWHWHGKRRSAWGYHFTEAGKQVRESREEWSKEDAQRAMAARMIGAPPPAPAGPLPAAPAGMTLATLLAKFLEERRASRKNKSAEDDAERCKPLLAFFGADTPVAAITTGRVAEYRLHRLRMRSRRGRLLSPTTINRERQVLRGALNMAAALEWCEIPKMPRFKMDDEHARERCLSTAECARLIAACKDSKTPLLAPMVLVALHTGLRCGELMALRWEQIDLTRGLIVLEGRQTKSRKSRHVPLDRDAYEALAPIRSDAGGLNATGSVWRGSHDVDTAFRYAVARAGLASADAEQHVRFHTLRHTFASHFAQRTGDLVKLQQILGHASIRTTQDVYAH